MTATRFAPFAAARVLGIFFLALAFAPPTHAQDVIRRGGDTELDLREPRRLKGLEMAMEVRFLTVEDEFVERVGVDLSGTITGSTSRNGQPVATAKIILEGYTTSPGSQQMTKTGRVTAVTDGDGLFQIPLRDLVDADSRGTILLGEVSSLRIQATGKNGKRVDLVLLRADTALGGLLP